MSHTPFTTLGGTLTIDFLNTLQMQQGQRVDLLQTSEDVNRWLDLMVASQKLVPLQKAQLVRGPGFFMDQLREFRLDCRTFLQMHQPFEQMASWMAGFVDQSPLTFRIDAHDGVVTIPIKGATVGLLSLLAYDWLKLKKIDYHSIRQCENAHCMAYFLNSSGRRKWCAMETCGNRQKSYRHYRKVKEDSYTRVRATHSHPTNAC
jgi:predicted RNA-binding Zn ribbon-like protein